LHPNHRRSQITHVFKRDATLVFFGVLRTPFTKNAP
jgi:hypothetical protein